MVSVNHLQYRVFEDCSMILKFNLSFFYLTGRTCGAWIHIIRHLLQTVLLLTEHW